MRALLVALVLSALPACGKGCGGSPDAVGSVPSTLRIPVLVDGVEGAPLDAALLGRIPPDFLDGERRAWRLGTLLGPLSGRPGTVIEIEDNEGVRTVISGGSDHEDGRQAVLAVNRTGEVRAARIRPEEPFPPFHGRGGNRGRSGDPTRIREVRRVLVHLAGARADAGARAGAGAMDATATALRVEIDGEPPVTWTREELDKAPRVALPQEGDEDEQRDAWSLRELVHRLVGPDAAVTEVTGGGGRTVKIDAAAWSDAARTPVLRGNRRGLLKFQWLDEKLQPMSGDKVRAVAALRIARAAKIPAPSRP